MTSGRIALQGVKLVVASTHTAPYKAPVWRHLSEVCGVDLTVFYAAMHGVEQYNDPLFNQPILWDIPLLEGYPWKRLRNCPMAWLNRRCTYNVPGLESVMAEGRFTHLLVEGKEYLYYHQALRAARKLGMKILYRAESHPAKSNWMLEQIARATRRAWYRGVDRFLCVGRYQYEEYAEFGIGRDRMFFSPYCVDDERFSTQHNEAMVHRQRIRRGYGFSDDTLVVGYSGSLYHRKNPMELVRAMGLLPEGARLGLLVVWDGPMRGEVEQVARAKIKGPLAFTGFLNQNKLAEGYTAMDMFVMPSLWETWGLVLNEAMICGLPVIATTGVNASRDLITDGVNGFSYASGDEAALADRILRVATSVRLGGVMGAASQMRIRDYSVTRACRGIVESLCA